MLFYLRKRQGNLAFFRFGRLDIRAADGQLAVDKLLSHYRSGAFLTSQMIPFAHPKR